MADANEGLDEVVRRVTEQVVTEMRGHEEQVFGVSDLHAYVTKLGKVGGDASAWKISYDTKRSPSIEALRELAQPGGEAAWKISYDTKRSPDVIERIVERGEEA
jgi:hypothetical protein